ncbi:MAG TPA: carboxylesterase/lipase family protein [Polyangiales bacterium]|nr:carboxylesterase/lipase family protein [Polyangiales bacterium]
MSKLHQRRGAALALALSLFNVSCSDSDPTEDEQPVETPPDRSTPAATVSAPDSDGDATTVKLLDGELQGDLVGNAVKFLKIPFAKPPVGALRWKAPVPNDKWNGVRHETAFASACPQPPSQQSPGSVDEDCLYLNVWRPNDTAPKHPTMVWIHGGGFTTGSAADLVPLSTDVLWYNGQPFAERGNVVVTINYRLGVFGFFPHPDLKKEGSPAGNQGLLDQRAALQWVQKNIAAFGGDPDNVTIFGESAGAGSVCMHVASPGSRGLFHRAVGESGGCTADLGPGSTMPDDALAQYARDRGCEGEGLLECLRSKPASDFVSMTMVDRTMGMDALRRNFTFGAIVDGPGGVLPVSARAAFDAGDIAKVPYILGTNTEEANLYFLAAAVPMSDAEYEAAINMRYGEFAGRVLQMYPISKFGGNYRKAMARISTDSGLVCGTLDTARRAVKAGLSVYMYNFNVPWSISRDGLGPSHASEISHVFGTPYLEMGAVAEVGNVMNAYWSSFAKTGDPNHAGAPATWPRYMPDANDNDQRIQFDPDYKILDSFRKEECQLWREYATR